MHLNSYIIIFYYNIIMVWNMNNISLFNTFLYEKNKELLLFETIEVNNLIEAIKVLREKFIQKTIVFILNLKNNKSYIAINCNDKDIDYIKNSVIATIKRNIEMNDLIQNFNNI